MLVGGEGEGEPPSKGCGTSNESNAQFIRRVIDQELDDFKQKIYERLSLFEDGLFDQQGSLCRPKAKPVTITGISDAPSREARDMPPSIEVRSRHVELSDQAEVVLPPCEETDKVDHWGVGGSPGDGPLRGEEPDEVDHWDVGGSPGDGGIVGKGSSDGHLRGDYNTSDSPPPSPTRASRVSRASRSSRHSTGSVDATGSKVPDMLDGALQLVSKFKAGARKARWYTCNQQHSLETAYFLEMHPFRGPIRVCVIHPVFDLFFGGVVIASVAMMGAEIQAAAQTPDQEFDNTTYLTLQAVCCIFFVIELVLRILAFGRGFFGFGVGTFVRSYKWNVFDLLCTVSMIVDLTLEYYYHEADADTAVVTQSRQGRMLRFFRLMRIVRALRVLRMVEFARELRKMSYALQYSFHTLLWAMLLLIFEMYFFATAFTQATTEAFIDAGADNSHLTELYDAYGTIPRSYLSLFQAITGGRDWHQLTEPLGLYTHWINFFFFIFYVSMTTFGVMNVITSVFVESALASVQHYKDLLIQENTKQKEAYIAHLKDVFACLDFDDSGEISHDEMDRLLHDSGLQQYMESIEIHPDDARTLFRLLDEDDSGFVNIDEFCTGCLKLKGDAKSYDVHCLLYENTRLIRKWQQYMDYLEHGFLPKMIKAVKKSVSELGETPKFRSSIESKSTRSSIQSGPATTRCII